MSIYETDKMERKDLCMKNHKQSACMYEYLVLHNNMSVRQSDITIVCLALFNKCCCLWLQKA